MVEGVFNFYFNFFNVEDSESDNFYYKSCGLMEGIYNLERGNEVIEKD